MILLGCGKNGKGFQSCCLRLEPIALMVLSISKFYFWGLCEKHDEGFQYLTEHESFDVRLKSHHLNFVKNRQGLVSWGCGKNDDFNNHYGTAFYMCLIFH